MNEKVEMPSICTKIRSQIESIGIDFLLAWELELNPEVTALPIFSQDFWFVSKIGDKVIAIDKLNGEINWDSSVDNDPLFPYATEYILDNHRLFVIYGSFLKHIDARNGEIIWEKQLSQEFALTPDILVVNDVVVIGGMKRGSAGYIAGFNVSTGEIIWEHETPMDSYSRRSIFSCSFSTVPNFRGESLVCLRLHGGVYTIDALDGSLIKSDLHIDPPKYDPFVVEDMLIFAPRKGPSVKIYNVALDETINTYASCQDVRPSQPPVVFEEKILIVSGCNDVYVVQLDEWNQQPHWVYTADTRIYSSLVTMDGEVGYVLDEKGEILAILLNDGELLGKLITHQVIEYDPTYANELYFDQQQNRLFALINGSNLYAFDRLETNAD